jgi:hypothetical protein
MEFLRFNWARLDILSTLLRSWSRAVVKFVSVWGFAGSLCIKRRLEINRTGR